MTAPRLVLVTRRFWPLVGGAEVAMAHLATSFDERGWPTRLLTARWDPSWPAELEHRGVPAVRLPQPSQRLWGTIRYMSALSRWLIAHREQFDLVYVSMLKHDAYAALSAARRANFPVVLRAEGAGLTGDVHWQLDARCGRRIKERCREADALVAPSRAVERELIAAGYPRQRIHYIPNGVPVPPARSMATRSQARACLARSHPALYLPDTSPLAVYTGRLHEAKGLSHLIEAWRHVAQRWPAAQLWLVGEGPEHRALVEQIREAELTNQVVLAGAFDDVRDLLVAADLFVLPSKDEGLSLALLEAMALGLPVVASDIPGNRQLIDHDVHGLLVPVGDPPALAAAIDRTLSDTAEATRRGAAARARVEAEYALQRTVADHQSLFEQVLTSRA